MVRKLALVMALSAAGLPNGAAALGLGDIDLNSYLNQPLEAEIPLRISSPEELQSLRVSLASRADFARAGIDYPSSLRRLEFDVIRDGAKPVIRVTSDGDFREPYVSFLLEVNWSRGRIMREYTLLVDPPVIAGQGGAAVSAPQTQRQTRAQTSQAQGAVSVPDRRSVAAEPRGLPAASRSADSYGPTQRDSTLWTIATEVRPDTSVTVEQTMMALQRLNPEAFIGGNVNQLKAGYVLKVPDRATVAAMSAAEARAEFRRQTQAWRRGDEATPETTTAVATPAGANQGRLQLLAPEGGEGAEAGVIAQQGGDAVTEAGAPVAGSADGSAVGTSEQDAALRQRIDQLQQQVQDLERLAQLKDDQLAALQAQLQGLGGEVAEPAPLPELQSDPLAAPADGIVQPTDEMIAAEPVPMMEPAAEPTDATPRRFGQPSGATRAAPGQADNPYAVSGYAPVDLNSLPTEAAPVAADEAAAADAAEPAGMLEQIGLWWQKTVDLFKANPLYLGIAVGVLLILLLAAMAVRQRRRAAAGFGESILQPAPEPKGEGVMAATAAGGAAVGAAAAADERQQSPQSEEQESSYLSDFSISGIDSTIESEVSEADPLTEADVFLAYGRYQPAENMIKEAIEAEPERLDLKVKLLEIYYAARNGEAFEQEAQTVHSLMEDHSDPAWQKVVEMGRDLRPGSPLFSDSGEALAEDLSPAGDDFDLEPEQAVKPAADDNLIDFDLGEMEEVQTEAAYETAAATGTDDAFERRNLSQERAGDRADEVSALSNDLDADIQAAAAPADEVADFDLSDLDLEPEARAQAEQGVMDDLDAAGEEPEEDVMDGGLLSDGDEVGTKLDLARAYIDMGDPDGARSILDEVLEEGSEDQKNEAEGLKAQIS